MAEHNALLAGLGQGRALYEEMQAGTDRLFRQTVGAGAGRPAEMAYFDEVLHRALVDRGGAEEPAVLTGGVARDPCNRSLLGQRSGVELLVPMEQPQGTGTFNAALRADEAGGVV